MSCCLAHRLPTLLAQVFKLISIIALASFISGCVCVCVRSSVQLFAALMLARLRLFGFFYAQSSLSHRYYHLLPASACVCKWVWVDFLFLILILLLLPLLSLYVLHIFLHCRASVAQLTHFLFVVFSPPDYFCMLFHALYFCSSTTMPSAISSHPQQNIAVTFIFECCSFSALFMRFCHCHTCCCHCCCLALNSNFHTWHPRQQPHPHLHLQPGQELTYSAFLAFYTLATVNAVAARMSVWLTVRSFAMQSFSIRAHFSTLKPLHGFDNSNTYKFSFLILYRNGKWINCTRQTSCYVKCATKTCHT